MNAETSPFLSLPRAVFGGSEIAVIATGLTFLEILTTAEVMYLRIGLSSGSVLSSPAFEPTEKNLTFLREYKTEIMDDLYQKLSGDPRPVYAQLTSAGS